MTNEVATVEDRIEGKIDKSVASGLDVSSDAGGMSFVNMAQVMEFAKLMSVSGVAVPKHLRGVPGACLGVVVQAVEWKFSPFAVANKSYSVNDRLAYEAQLLHAVVLQRAPIKGRVKVEYINEGDARVCRVWAELRDGGEIVEYRSPAFGRITPKNSPLWKTDPDQQQFYFSVRALARRHFPDVILGVYAVDEIDGETKVLRDVTPAPNRLLEKLSGAPKGQNGFSEGFVAREIDGGEIITNEPAPDAGGEPVSAGMAPTGGDAAANADASPAASAADPEPVSEWFAKGSEAARAGMSRKAIPPELRGADRADDAAQWTAGFDSERAA